MYYDHGQYHFLNKTSLVNLFFSLKNVPVLANPMENWKLQVFKLPQIWECVCQTTARPHKMAAY